MACLKRNVPARRDRLPRRCFHRPVVGALGIIWSLDGLEVTLVGSRSAAISESRVPRLSAGELGLAASACSPSRCSSTCWPLSPSACRGMSGLFVAFRFLTGAGIGGEYSAVNATIQELIPARFRGSTEMATNGSFWLEAAFGAVGNQWCSTPAVMPAEYGWRLEFRIGGGLGFFLLLRRRFLPESPRWLMTHGQPRQAEFVADGIKVRVEHETNAPLSAAALGECLRLRTDIKSWFGPSVARCGRLGVLLKRGPVHLRPRSQKSVSGRFEGCVMDSVICVRNTPP